MKKAFAVFAALIFLNAYSSAAPAAKKPAAPLPPAGLATGVLLNAITRNETTSKVAFALAKNGVALAPIVISEKAGPRTKLAAEEMQKYLSKMSGADFKVETGDGQSGIALATMAEFPVPALEKALEIRHSINGKESYAIRTREKRILLLGATDLAVGHAVYRFLEELGCRWFFPSASNDWENIPSISDLKFQKDLTDRPAFLDQVI